MAAFAGIPGPEPTFPLGNASDFFGEKPWHVLARYGRQFGPMSVIWLGGTPAIVLHDARLIGEVLIERMDEFYKDAPHDALAPVITPQCMFISNGASWRFMREGSPYSQPWFAKWLESQQEVVRDIVRRAIRDWSESSQGYVSDLVDSIRRLAYDVFCRLVWGGESSGSGYRAFLELASEGNMRMQEPPPLAKLPPLSPFFYAARSQWYGEFASLLEAARREQNPPGDDLLRTTLRHGSRLNDDQLRLVLSAPLFFGGVFSTASVLATTLYCLALQAADYRAAAESARHVGPDNSSSPVDHALRETMRLWPPVPLYFRNVRRDRAVEFGGRSLPPNTLLMISNWLLHRDSQIWGDGETYRPDRWSRGGVERIPLGSDYYFPFGRGPRTCVGQELALFVMREALTQILAMAEVRFDPSQTYRPGYFFAVTHPAGLAARVVLRP